MKQPTPSQSTPIPPLGPTASVDTATIELLAAWRREDATTDSELIRAADQELADFKKTLNENRSAAAERKLFP